jgi:D-beta-D-heptose 7-phosphate kinase/D-beta-D-heptose 1-phosphate adenosyltransferase
MLRSAVELFVTNFHKCRLLIVGDVMLDEYIWGSVRRICPEAPVPIVEEMRRSSVPGGMANVAVNAAALGAQVAVGSIVGADAQGDTLRNTLEQQGIDASGIRTDHQRPTTVKTRIIAHNQQVARVDREVTRSITSAMEQELLEWFRGRLPAADVCIISDYSKGVLTSVLISEMMALSHKHGCPVVVDPKGWDYRRYRGALLISPNLHEARHALTNGAPPPDDLFALGAGLRKLLPGTSVLITCGSEGVALFRDEEPPLVIPSLARQVYDVTGAGDTLIATLAVAIAAGCSLDLAAALANAAAGVVVGKVGTATVSASEILAIGGLIEGKHSMADLAATHVVGPTADCGTDGRS